MLMHNISRYLIEECHLHRYLGLMMSSAVIWIGGIVAYLTARIIFMPIMGCYDRFMLALDRKLGFVEK